jgi:hypothetical protein
MTSEDEFQAYLATLDAAPKILRHEPELASPLATISASSSAVTAAAATASGSDACKSPVDEDEVASVIIDGGDVIEHDGALVSPASASTGSSSGGEASSTLSTSTSSLSSTTSTRRSKLDVHDDSSSRAPIRVDSLVHAAAHNDERDYVTWIRGTLTRWYTYYAFNPFTVARNFFSKSKK